MENSYQYSITDYPNAEFPLTIKHFNLEKEAFGNYKACPSDFNNYKKIYTQKNFIICNCYFKSELIGYKLTEKIINNHFHHHIVVVKNEYKGHGIAKKISIFLNAELKNRKIKHFTLFSVPESVHFEIEGNDYKKISDSESLDECEYELLKNLEYKKGLSLNKNRIQVNYYKMNDGTFTDALLKSFELK